MPVPSYDITSAPKSLSEIKLPPVPSLRAQIVSSNSTALPTLHPKGRPATSPAMQHRTHMHSNSSSHITNVPINLSPLQVLSSHEEPPSRIRPLSGNNPPTGRTSSENAAASIFSMYIDRSPISETSEGTIVLHTSQPPETGSSEKPISRILDPIPAYPSVSRENERLSGDSGLSHDSVTRLAYLDGIVDPKLPRAESTHYATDGGRRPKSSTSGKLEDPMTRASRTTIPGDSYSRPSFPSTSPSPSNSVRSPMRPRSSRAKMNGPQLTGSPLDVQENPLTVHPSPASARPSSSTNDNHNVSSRLSSSLGHLDSTNIQPSGLSIMFPHSPHKGSVTASAESSSVLSQPRSHRGADEAADAEYVRGVYARFDAMGGVVGDGYEEGIERTRARVPSTTGVIQLDEAGVVKGAEITEKEEQRLRNVDRYGFFTDSKSFRRESRLTLLPIAPFSRRIKRLGPSAPSTISKQSPSPPEFKVTSLSKPPTREASRLAKWNRMMRSKKDGPGGTATTWVPDGHGTNPGKFQERVWKGIPDQWRPVVWQLLIARKTASANSTPPLSKIEQHYRDNIDVPSKQDVQIDLDVPRTVNDHILFHTRYGQGQRSLFHILHCVSLYCTACEYCQGMGSIAATFLFYLDPESSYLSLVRLHDVYNMHSIFSPGFPGLLENIYVQERLIETLMPEVYKSFQKNMVSTTSYATKWYITLFANSVPYQMQLRIWDVFLLEGQDIIVLFAIAILWALKEYLASPQATFETVLSLVSSFFVPEDEDVVVLWVRKLAEVKDLRSSMSEWRTKWRALVASGQDRTALL